MLIKYIKGLYNSANVDKFGGTCWQESTLIKKDDHIISMLDVNEKKKMKEKIRTRNVYV